VPSSIPKIDAGQPIDRGCGDPAADALLQMQGRGDVIGVDMGVERQRQSEVK
jgi:hypothetical protein